MHIAFIADEAYAPALAVAVRSVLLHSLMPQASGHTPPAGERAQITLWVMDLGLSSSSKVSLENLVNTFHHHFGHTPGADATVRDAHVAGVHLRWLHAPSGTVHAQAEAYMQAWAGVSCHTNMQRMRPVWSKLLLPLLLPQELDYVLYMDTDTLACGSLWPLWQQTSSSLQQGHVLAAVRDYGFPWGHAGLQPWGWCMDSRRAESGTQQKYFNAGVMLLHLPRLRELLHAHGPLLGQATAASHGQRAGIPPNLIPCAQDADSYPDSRCTVHGASAHAGQLQYHEQDLLNLACRGGCWLPLPLHWNVQGMGTYMRDRVHEQHGRPALFTPSECDALVHAPGIIHYTGTASPSPAQLLSPWVREPTKPWAVACEHPAAEQWWAALDATPWAGWRPAQQEHALAASGAHELTRLAQHLGKAPQHSGCTFQPHTFLTCLAKQVTDAAMDAGSGNVPHSVEAGPTVNEAAAAAADGTPSSATAGDTNADAYACSVAAAVDVLADVPGLDFTVDWFSAHAFAWEAHVVPLLAGRPHLRLLEVGCWEGRSACWCMARMGTHDTARMVCIDPYDKLHAPFVDNRRRMHANLRASGHGHKVCHIQDSSLPALSAMLLYTHKRQAGVLPPTTVTHTAPTPGSGPCVCAAHQYEAWACSALGTASIEQDSSAAAVGSGNESTATGSKSSWATGCSSGLFDLAYIDGSHLRLDVLSDAVMCWALLREGGLMVLDDYEWDRYRHNMACHPQQAVDAFLQVVGHCSHVLHKQYQVIVQKVTLHP